MPTRRHFSAAIIAALCLATIASPGHAQSGRQTITINGEERHYVVTVPDGVEDVPGGVPLVLVLHGAGGNGPNVMAMSRFDEKAEEEGFIAVFPEGTTRGIYVGNNLFLTWNAEHCCGYALSNETDDIGFITALLDKLERDYPIDPNRIYVAGMSNGAMMTHQIALALSDRIAAIGTVVGAMFGDEFPPRNPVSAIIINAAEDDLIPIEGGALGLGLLMPDDWAWDGTPLAPSEFQATFWAMANGCVSKPVFVDRKPEFTQTGFLCPEGIGVEYYVVEDNGHAWPGDTRITPMGRDANNDFDATGVMWTFFERHPLVTRDAPPADGEVDPQSPGSVQF